MTEDRFLSLSSLFFLKTLELMLPESPPAAIKPKPGAEPVDALSK